MACFFCEWVSLCASKILYVLEAEFLSNSIFVCFQMDSCNILRLEEVSSVELDTYLGVLEMILRVMVWTLSSFSS